MMNIDNLTRDQLRRMVDVLLPTVERYGSEECFAARDACRAIAAELRKPTELRGFHTHSDWQFLRGPEGSVAVITPEGDEHVIDSRVWCSIVASMSAGGESDLRWYAAKALHDSTGPQRVIPECLVVDATEERRCLVQNLVAACIVDEQAGVAYVAAKEDACAKLDAAKRSAASVTNALHEYLSAVDRSHNA